MFHRILCPIDFSPGSRRAMEIAIQLAKPAGAELILAHAWHLPAMAAAGEYPVPPETVQALVDDAARGLAQAAGEAKDLGARVVTTSFLSGVPWEQLVAALEADPTIDLVVMGTHGRTGLRRLLIGSVTEKVVRHAPCPVLAVRDDSPIAPFRHVLCPVDFSASARRAMELAGEVAAAGGAGVALLHVLETPGTYTGELALADYLAQAEAPAARMLEQWAAELRAKVAVPVTAAVRTGNAAPEILGAIERDASIDLVVTGSHGRTGMRRTLIGSVAEKTVRHARCPVLVVRQRAEVRAPTT
jgi:nucleotide-binding universal stress UspA family protein